MYNLKRKRISNILTSTLLFLVTFVVNIPDASHAVSNNPSAVCTGASCTVTFTYTGDYYLWTIPSGVTTITFDVIGAAGGSASGGAGGKGGRITGNLSVTANSNLYVYVGGQGTSATNTADQTSAGGWNGGGSGTFDNSGQVQNGAGGGGGSDIRTSTNLSTRLIVAGGGGGAASSNCGAGGAGGGTTGGTGNFCSSAVAGGGGTQSGGGTAHTNRGATAGTLGQGGSAASANAWGSAGGGGGYYGGGAGSSTADHGAGYSASGGGGSSFSNATYASSVAHTQGHQSGNGQIVIGYSTPDVTAPSFSSSTSFSVSENISISTAAATIKISESATVTITGGVDSSLFTIANTDTVTAQIKFKTSPNYESPTDTGANNVYDLILTATDLASNSGTQTITITVTDVVDTSSFNSFALAGGVTSATFRGTIQINASVTVASKVTFKAANIVIAGCKGKLATGSGSTYTVSCSWKPSKRGGITLSATSTPTNVSISGATAAPINVAVVNRTGPR